MSISLSGEALEIVSGLLIYIKHFQAIHFFQRFLPDSPRIAHTQCYISSELESVHEIGSTEARAIADFKTASALQAILSEQQRNLLEFSGCGIFVRTVPTSKRSEQATALATYQISWKKCGDKKLDRLYACINYSHLQPACRSVLDRFSSSAGYF
uniref:Uncharacterized protein n=1 Tax=Setaria digitata TaxID=48799 RepID=A0A915PDF2_9BILA